MALRAVLSELLKLFLEIPDRAERAVDGGEPDIGHLIGFPEFVHHLLSDDGGGDLLFAGIENKPLNSIDDGFLFLGRNGPLFQCLLDSEPDLFAVVVSPRSVLFHDEGPGDLGTLVGREPVAAGFAFPPAADGIAFLGRPAIDDPAV